MIVAFVFILIRIVVTGTHFPISSGSMALFKKFQETIISEDIYSLELILTTMNSKFSKSMVVEPYRNEGFLLAIEEGKGRVVRVLLKKGNVNAGWKDNLAIRVASARGDTEIVAMLLQRVEVNPGVMNNNALVMAAKNGYVDIIRLLLVHPKVDPRIGGDMAAYWATTRNDADIVKLFLRDSRMTRSIFKIYTLQRAAEFGNVGLVRYLFQYEYFSSQAYLIATSSRVNLVSIRTLVEAGYKMDETALNKCLQNARFGGFDDIVEYLESLLVRDTPTLPARPLISMTEQCAICLSDENLLEGFITTCNHQFHVDCLEKWIAKHNSCPMCRSSVL